LFLIIKWLQSRKTYKSFLYEKVYQNKDINKIITTECKIIEEAYPFNTKKPIIL